MKITVITIARNEELILPFFLRHYDFADEFIIYDNHSKDDTIEIARACKKARVLNLNTALEYRDSMLLAIKNQIYRVLPGEWFIIVDCDEFVWHQDGIRPYLEMCSRGGCTLPRVVGFDMFSPKVPKNDGRSSLIDLIQNGIRSDWYDKRVLVHRDVEINYLPGCHLCHPCGRCTTWPQAEVKLLHYKWLSEEYALQKSRERMRNICVENKINGWGGENETEMRLHYRKSFAAARNVFTAPI